MPLHHSLSTPECSLQSAGMYDKAGALLERMKEPQRALDAYVRGNAYRNAVELARKSFPREVVGLEKAWADWLVKQKQVEAAINHYIEAGAYADAINAAMAARQVRARARRWGGWRFSIRHFHF